VTSCPKKFPRWQRNFCGARDFFWVEGDFMSQEISEVAEKFLWCQRFFLG
jgi:hypothetical protein